jgi:WhiB family transcriptional regulator, redox-sensing transcriptional regulator
VTMAMLVVQALDWTSYAACRGHDTDLWFVEGHEGSYREARVICAACPVTSECLQWALDTKTDHGLFGGLSPLERKHLRGWSVP